LVTGAIVVPSSLLEDELDDPLLAVVPDELAPLELVPLDVAPALFVSGVLLFEQAPARRNPANNGAATFRARCRARGTETEMSAMSSILILGLLRERAPAMNV
jgi:hypothetical protein